MGKSRTRPRQPLDAANQGGGKSWFESGKATNAIAIAALMISVVFSSPVYPYVQGLFREAPQARFASLPSAAVLAADVGFTLTVSSSNIPDSSDLWFIIRNGKGEWYPWGRISPNGTFSISHACTGTGAQSLQVWMVPDSEESPLLNYLEQGQHGGLTSLGSPSATELKSQTIHVKKKNC